MKSNLLYAIVNVLLTTIFPVLLFPYVSRTLGVESIGVYSFYSQTFSYIGLLTSFGINIYGVKEVGKYKNDIVRKSQVAVELLIFNLLNVIFVIIFITFFTLIRVDPDDYFIILAFTTILFSNFLSVEWFFVGTGKQKYILIRNFIVRLISMGLIFYYVNSETDLYLYITIMSLSFLIISVFNIFFFLKELSLRTLVKVNITRHFRFLVIILFIEVSYRYFGLADVIILGFFHSKIEIGYYSMALNIFSILVSLIRVSALTLLPKVSYSLESGNRVEYVSVINKTIKFIMFIGVPASISVFMWSDFIIFVLGGNEFYKSAYILKYFAPQLIVSSMINMVIFQILYPQNQIKGIMFPLVLGILLNLTINGLFVPKYGAEGVVLTSLLSQIVVLGLLVKLNSNYFLPSFITKDMLTYIYSGVIFIFFAKLARYTFGLENEIIQFLIGLSSYFTFLYFMNKKEMNRFINKRMI